MSLEKSGWVRQPKDYLTPRGDGRGLAANFWMFRLRRRRDKPSSFSKGGSTVNIVLSCAKIHRAQCLVGKFKDQLVEQEGQNIRVDPGIQPRPGQLLLEHLRRAQCRLCPAGNQRTGRMGSTRDLGLWPAKWRRGGPLGPQNSPKTKIPSVLKGNHRNRTFLL